MRRISLKRSRGFDYALLIAALIVGGFDVLALRQPGAAASNDPSLWAVLIFAAVLGGYALLRMDRWLPEGSALPHPVEPGSKRAKRNGVILLGVAGLLTGYVVFRLWPDYTKWNGTVLPWILALLLVFASGFVIDGWGDPTRKPKKENVRSVFDLHIPIWVEVVGVIAIFALGVFLRIYRLDYYPAGIYVDETNSGLDALRILEGEKASPFGTGWYGTPNGYIYYMVLLIKLFGANYYTVKAVSLIPAILTILAIYPLGRMMFGPIGGLSTMLFMAVSRWHLSMSRFGWNETAVPLFQILATYFLLRGLRERCAKDFIVGGLISGMMLYIYLSSRLALATMGLFIVYWILADPEGPAKSFKKNISGILLFTVAGIIAFAPLAVTHITDPFTFSNRINQISVFKDIKASGSWQPLVQNIQDILRFFHQVGDHQGKHNLPYEPETDPVTGLLFVIGLVYALLRLRDRRRGLLWFWLLFGLAGSVFSSHNESPQSYRSLTALPAVMLLAGDVLSRIVRGSFRVIPKEAAGSQLKLYRDGFKLAGISLLIFALIGSAAWESNVFLNQQMMSLDVQSWFNLTENVVAKQVLEDLKTNKPVYLSPNFYGDSPMQFQVYGYEKSTTGENSLANPPYFLVRPEDTLPIANPGKDADFLLDQAYVPVTSYFQSFYPHAQIQTVNWDGKIPLYQSISVPEADFAAIQGLNIRTTFADGKVQDGTANDLGQFEDANGVTQVEWNGSLNIPKSETYRFSASNGAQLTIDGLPADQDRFYCSGLHPVKITWSDPTTGTKPQLSWNITDGESSPIPATAWFRIGPPEKGLTAYYYRGSDWQGEPLCKKNTPFLWLAWPDKEPVPDEFSAKFKGYLHVQVAGEYRLVIDADDGARLSLDGNVLAEGLVPNRPNDLSATIVLTQGDHPIEIDYFQTGGGSALEFQWQPPNQDLTIVPPDALLPEKQ